MIRSYGLEPGIWVAPFLLCRESETALAHPEWILRYFYGRPVTLQISRPCVVLDLSRVDDA